MALIPLLMVIFLGAVNGATHTNVVRLHENLTKSYNKDVRPTFNQSEPTRVNVFFSLLSIKELDEKTSKLAIVGVFVFTWNDFQLKWSAEEYGNIFSTFLPHNMVWKPEMVEMNPYDEIEPLGYDRQTVRVIYNGDIYWSPANVYQSTCPVDVTFYPFDVQTCSLIFNSLTYLPSEVFFETMTSKLDLSYFYPNGLWEVEDTKIDIWTSGSQLVVLSIKLKRRSVFHLLNTLIPMCVIGLLNILVFLLPAEAGERVSFSITVLLAMAVFMSIVTDSLPSNSEPNVPRLCYLLSFDLAANVLVTVCAILGLRLYHKPDTQKVPKWLRYLVCCNMCFSKKRCGTNRSLLTDKVVINLPRSESNNDNPQGIDISGNNSEQLATSKKPSVDITWRDVAVFFDKLFFVLFLVALFAKNIVAVFIFLHQ